MGRGQWGGGDWDGEMGETEMGDGEEEGKMEKSWQGPGVGRKGGGRRVDKKEWGGEGRQDWDNREETGGAMGRGRWRGGNGKGETGGGKGNGEKKGKEEEAFYRWI